MDKKILDTLFVVATVGLLTAGIIFLCIGFFGNATRINPFTYALICIVPASIFNLLRVLGKRQK